METTGALSRVPLSGLPYTLPEGLAARLRSPRDGASGRRRASASPGLVVAAAVAAPGPAGIGRPRASCPMSKRVAAPAGRGSSLPRTARHKKSAHSAHDFVPSPAACRKTGGRVDRGRGARGQAHMMGRSYLRPRPSPVSAHAPYSGRSGWRSGRRSFAACLLERLSRRGTDAHEPHGSSGQKLGGAPVLLDEAGSCRRAGSVRVSASVA